MICLFTPVSKSYCQHLCTHQSTGEKLQNGKFHIGVVGNPPLILHCHSCPVCHSHSCSGFLTNWNINAYWDCTILCHPDFHTNRNLHTYEIVPPTITATMRPTPAGNLVLNSSFDLGTTYSPTYWAWLPFTGACSKMVYNDPVKAHSDPKFLAIAISSDYLSCLSVYEDIWQLSIVGTTTRWASGLDLPGHHKPSRLASNIQVDHHPLWPIKSPIWITPGNVSKTLLLFLIQGILPNFES